MAKQSDKAAYEEYRNQGGTGPDGGPLPEWNAADDRTKQHVAQAVQAQQQSQPQ